MPGTALGAPGATCAQRVRRRPRRHAAPPAAPRTQELLLGTQRDSQAPCEDAAEGSNCYMAVMYLKSTGFKRHPDWYPGLSADSLFQDAQDTLNKTGKSH